MRLLEPLRARLPLALMALVLYLPAAPLRADGELSGDLGAGAALDPEIDGKVEALLQKARKLLDKSKYAEARAVLEEADDLAPMDDRVLELLDVVGQLESEEEGAQKLLVQIEAERKAKEEEQKKVGQGLEAILERHGLPKQLPQATARLADKLKLSEGTAAKAEKARDKCLAGATLSHAAAGARQCRPLEEKLEQARKESRLLADDLAALDEVFEKRKGKKALARLKKQQKRG
ncbi:MAG: hypothetical protein P1V51_21035 [Deltaproteobacteria bacterium]|nr:hypothetical protein [Deltaproteobacteria bacterium]